MKTKHIRPGLPLADTAPANDNTAEEVVAFVRGLPAPVQAQVRDALGWAPAPPANLEAAIAEHPVEALRRASARHFSLAALRQRMLDERDACYRALASSLPAQRSGYGLAEAIRKEMKRYRDDGSWRFDRGGAPPADPRKRLMHRILTLDQGNEGPIIRSRQTIGRALAGTRSKTRL
jgi:hypothetical protein